MKTWIRGKNSYESFFVGSARIRFGQRQGREFVALRAQQPLHQLVVGQRVAEAVELGRIGWPSDHGGAHTDHAAHELLTVDQGWVGHATLGCWSMMEFSRRTCAMMRSQISSASMLT